MNIKIHFTRLILLIVSAFILNSCAYLKEKAVAYKYRNDYRVTTKWEKGDLTSARLPTVKSLPNEDML